ncbi:MAG: hypothetical protein QM730_01015 [Anaerolineales bacterium]
MKFYFRPMIAILLLGLAMLACSSSITTVEETPPPTPEQADLPTPAPATPNALLPQPLYFLAFDGQSIKQVFRLERDGKAEKQLTFESANVTNYDVSLADGSLAFESNNQLLLANADGLNRRVLADGARYPVFSPDGKNSCLQLERTDVLRSRDGHFQSGVTRPTTRWFVASGTLYTRQIFARWNKTSPRSWSPA